MGDYNDLDELLALEEDLLFGDEGGGSKKRSFQDAASAREASRSLGPATGSKRTRMQPGPGTSGAGAEVGGGAWDEDDELLALAAGGTSAALGSQAGGGHSSRGAMAAAAARDIPPRLELGSEDQELLQLADMLSQPSQQPSQGPLRRRQGAGASQLLSGLGSEVDTELAALAAASSRRGADAMELDPALAELLQHDDSAPGTAQQQPHGTPGEARQRQRRGGAGGSGGWRDSEVIPRRTMLPPQQNVLAMGGSDYLTVTLESGERVYCQREKAQAASRVDVVASLRRCRGRLLSSDIHTLLGEVEADNYQRAMTEAEAEAKIAAVTQEPGTSAAAAAGRGGGRGTAAQPGRSSGGSKGALWVQKYSPKTFWDLLSDEKINREVVQWLKGWDPCVFGRPAPPAPQQPCGGGGSKAYFKAGVAAPDPLGRPEHKVILLAGPPGLGKTTLAHVVARHCGYRPLEINASDDRSGHTLSARIADAVEMRSVMGEKRPNCVIIDEIDGATGGAEGRSAIAALIKIINAQPAKSMRGPGRGPGGQSQQRQQQGQGDEGEEGDSEDEEQEGRGEEWGSSSSRRRRGGGARAGEGAGPGRGKSGAKRVLRPLMRPIICICNDLYAPTLRPLREVAKVFHFRKPQAERLAQRLQVVCSWEGLHADKSALRGLVDRTDADIRACLNTLQFVAKRCASGVVRGSDLAGVQVGQKDMTKGAFSVWTDLLQKKVERAGIGARTESDSERHSRLFGALMDFGEHELVLSGVHENVLSLRYMDVGLQRTAAITANLGDADRLMRAAHRRMDFSLYKYIPSSLVAISVLVAGHERPQLQWPKAGADARRRTAASQALLQGWMMGLEHSVFCATGPRAMVLEVLPSLLHITAPPLRPVSRHLFSREEAQTLAGVVGAMLSYGLRFAQEGDGGAEEGADIAGQRELQLRGVRRPPEEQPMRFKPQVHRLCQFPGMDPQGRRLPTAIRLLITHEVELEAIRRAEAVRRGRAGGSGDALEQSPPGAGAGGPRERNANVGAPSQLVAGRTVATLAERMKGVQQQQQAAKKALSAASRGTWLDQLKERKLASKRPAGAGRGTGAASPGGVGRGQLPVLFKYHEGYTNAVKRPLKMSELL